MATELGELNGFANALTVPVACELPGYPLSKYMRRFLDLGQPIHFVQARRVPSWQADPARLPPVAAGFRVRWSSAGND